VDKDRPYLLLCDVHGDFFICHPATQSFRKASVMVVPQLTMRSSSYAGPVQSSDQNTGIDSSTCAQAGPESCRTTYLGR